MEALCAKLSAAYMAVAVSLSNEGLWPDSLYYSDRAKALVPLSPSVAKHEAKIRTRVAFLHLGPPIGVAAVAAILAVLIEQPLILLPAVAAITVALACHIGLGLKIQGTLQAFVHSSALSITLALAVGIPICSQMPALALLSAAAIVIADLRLFKSFKTKLLRADPPKGLNSDPQEAIRQITRLLADDWQNITQSYLALPSLSSYFGQMKELSAKAAEAEARRQAQADKVSEQYKARVSQNGQRVVDGFDKLLQLISDYTQALNHQNSRKLQSLGLEIQQLGQTLWQQIAEFEKLCKSPPDSIEIQHKGGRKERVKLKIIIAENASTAYLQTIKPIAQAAANLPNDPANSLTSIVKHLPAAQTAMAQVQQHRHVAAASAAPVTA